MEKQIKIHWATNKRSYLNSFSSLSPYLIFDGGESRITDSKKHQFLSKVASSTFFDIVGYFMRPEAKNCNCDFYISFNKFLKSDRPYVLLLEMPEAPGHYSGPRFLMPLGKKRLSKCLADPNLKVIVPISAACEKAIPTVWRGQHINCPIVQNYIFVVDNPFINEEKITTFCDDNINCLYVATGFRFRSKGGLEVLDAFSRLPSKFHLTIITKIDMLKESDLAMIQSNKNIELKDFKLSSSQMQQEYASHQILLHLSSDDSSPLAVMEAMKGGECIISTKIYAITEMVTDGMNGFLTNPKYQYFRDDLSVDKRLEKRKMHYLNNSPVNKQISDFIVEKLTYLDFQRKQLCEMRLASYREATKGKFSKKAIADKWGKIFGI